MNMFEKCRSNFKIDSVEVGDNAPCYFIADIAANHDGDLERAKDLIFLAAENGANAAKFQHFQASTIVSDYGFKNLGSQQSHQAKWSKSVFEVYKDASIDVTWTQSLKETCGKAGISFFTSPYDFDMVDHIEPFAAAFKIGSGDITWIEMVEYIARKKKPYIVATGASTMDDVTRAVHAGTKINDEIALLQCNTNYTGSIENMGFVQLNVLKTYRAMFPSMVLGLSDHTPKHATVLGAIALGAKIIEKHFTDDVTRIGPDHGFSMDPRSWLEMVERSRELEAALGYGSKKVEENEKETVVLQRRCLRVRKSLKAGHILKKDDLFPLRPAPENSIEPYKLKELIGRRISRDLAGGEHLTFFDFS